MEKTAFITGASNGIGLALAQQLLKDGYKVYGTSRNGTVDAIENENFESFALDLSNHTTVESLGKKIEQKGIKIDLLINNAGIGPDLNTSRPSRHTFEQTLAVNLTGTVFVTEVLEKQLRTGATVVFISSRMGSIDDRKRTDSVGYRVSKAGLNMYASIMVDRLADDQKVAIIHPGFVKTNISPMNENGNLTPKESAKRITKFITGDFESGVFWDVEGKGKLKW